MILSISNEASACIYNASGMQVIVKATFINNPNSSDE